MGQADGKEGGKGQRTVHWRHWAIWQPLADGDFFRLWLANGLWWQAMWIEMLALGWLVYDVTDSPGWVQFAAFARALPLLLFGVFSAQVVDRFRRRLIIQVVQVTNTLCIGAVTLLLWWGQLELWHIIAFSLVSGTGWAIDWPARRSLIPDLVGKERVVDAMVLENVVQSATRISGPLLAGWVMTQLGTAGALAVLTVTGILTVLLLSGMKTNARAPVPPHGWRHGLQQVGEGLRFVRGKPPIWGVLLITVVMNVWTFPYMNLLPVFARDILHQGPLGLGWLGAASGLGASVGLVGVTFLRRRMSREWIFAGFSVLSCIGVVGFSISTTFSLAMVMLVVSGIGQAGFSTMQSSIILLEATDEMRSRAMGALVLAIGGGPIGRLQSGLMAEWWGAPLAVGTMAGWAGLATAGLALAVPGYLGPLWARRKKDD
ncbi:MAG: MFS transporter [Candidatus Latescibacteria bacterium]|nr:MFS transporter [Candidatus Latescibacterota bacterium]